MFGKMKKKIFFMFVFGIILFSLVSGGVLAKNWTFHNYTVNVGNDLHVNGTIFGNGAGLTNLNASAVNYWKKNVNDLYYNDGKVGIGTSSPTYKLDINSGTLRMLNVGGTSLRIAGANSDTSIFRVDASNGETDSGNYGFSLKYMGSRSGNENTLSLFADQQTGSQVEAVTIQQNGNVGIGTTSPGMNLDVNGNVRAQNRLYVGTGGGYFIVIQVQE